MTGFPSALGVVRVHMRSGQIVASLPKPLFQARKLCADTVTSLAKEADAPTLVLFTGAEEDVWIRAREVDAVDVVSTEDPGAGS